MSRIKRLACDSVILGIGTFSSKLLVFFLMPLYTALLSAEQFGTAEIITSSANLIIPIAGIGVGNAIFRYVADRESNREEVLSSGVVLLGCGLGVFLLLSPLLSLIGYLDGYVWLVVLYVLFANLHSLVAQYVRAIGATRLFALQGILNTVLTILFNLLFLLGWSMGVTGYVLSVILGNLVTLLFLVFAVRLHRVVRFSSVRKRTVLEMLRFGLPLVPTTVCWLITDLSDRYMVTAFCGEAATGIYSAAYKLPTVITLLSGIFMQAWQFSAVTGTSNEEDCRSFYSQVFSGFLSLMMIGGACMVLASRFLTGFLLNVSYFSAWKYMPTLICAAVLEALVAFLATVYLVKKKSMHSFVTAMGGCLLNVLLNLMLIPSNGVLGGALGAAIATLAAYAFVLLLRIADVRRMLPFRMCSLRMVVSILLLLAEAAVMTYAEKGRLLLSIGCTVAILAINAYPMWKCACRWIKTRKKNI